MEIKKGNIATTDRPTEYIGTIAIDGITAGKSMEQLIEKSVKEHVDNGYQFNGLKIHIGHTHELNALKSHHVDVLLSKYNHETETQHNIVVQREINLFEIITSLTAISLQFTSNVDFNGDSIDWDNLENPEN